MADPMVFQFIGDTVTNATNSFIAPAASNLIYTLQMVALTGVTLYIVLTGYAIISGSVQEPFWAFIKQCVKILFITAFALSVDGYTNTILGVLQDLESGLSEAMRVSTATNPLTIYQVLDQSLGKGLELVAQCFERAGNAGITSFGTCIGWVIAGCCVAIGTLMVSMMGASVVIVAKFSLAIVFALGPLFIFCLMFPMTAKFFDSWFSQVLSYTLTIVVMAVIMMFAMKSYDVFIAGADFKGSDDNPMFAALQILALTGVLYHLIKQAGSIASGLAGGISMTALTLRQIAAPVMSTQRGITQVVNGQSTRRDLESGQMKTAGRLNHLAAGNTVWNPAYRQHVKENFGKNWGDAKGGSVGKG